MVLFQLPADVGNMGRLVSKLYKGNIRGLSFLELHEAQVKDAMNYLTVSEVYVNNCHEINRSSLLSISELLILCTVYRNVWVW